MQSGLDPGQLRDNVVVPVLGVLGLNNLQAEKLVMGTAAQESKLKYLRQLGHGPALGLWQMESATHNDIWNNYIRYRPSLESNVRSLIGSQTGIPTPLLMVGNLYYACAMCRVHYLRDSAPLPTTLEGMAKTWKRVYNTHKGKGTVEEFISSWELVRGLYD